MDSKNGFVRMSVSEFKTWIRQQSTSRTITHVQEHHTWLPSYAQFKGNNHFEMQLGMKNSHVQGNGWSDIGQHFSIFPDGMVVTGRPLNSSPACIAGHNSGGICIENVGNFDSGKDIMTAAQSDAIVAITALLCERYKLDINDINIVYHHWFDSSGNRTTTHPVKSCPGTAFFGGNDLSNAETNFFPLVANYLSNSQPEVLNDHQLAMPTQDQLPVRENPDPYAKILKRLTLADEVRVERIAGNWAKLLPDGWVFATKLQTFKRAQVTASTLNVRTIASTSGEIVKKISQNEIVRVFEEKNGWGRIGPFTTPTTSMWINLGYTKWL